MTRPSPTHSPELFARTGKRRRCTRYHYRAVRAVRYLGRSAPPSDLAVIRDISAAGAGLVLGHDPGPEAVLLLRLPLRCGEESHTRAARVAHATPQPDGTWLVGCCFSLPLTDEELALVRGSTASRIPSPPSARHPCPAWATLGTIRPFFGRRDVLPPRRPLTRRGAGPRMPGRPGCLREWPRLRPAGDPEELLSSRGSFRPAGPPPLASL